MAPLLSRQVGHHLMFLVALCGLVACSEDNTSGKTKGGSGLEACLDPAAQGTNLDCYAKLELTRLPTNVRITGAKEDLVTVAVGGQTVGTSVDIEFRLRNTIGVATAAPLAIDDIWLQYTPRSPSEQGSDLALTCVDGTGLASCASRKGQWNKVVPAGTEDPAKQWLGQETFKVRYKHFDNNVREAKVCLRLGGDPEYASKDLCFPLKTELGRPRLAVQPGELDFPYVKLGTEESKTLQVVNSGDATLVVSRLDLSDLPSQWKVVVGDQTLTGGGPSVNLDVPLVVAPSNLKTMEVRYKPIGETKQLGVIRVFSNDPAIVGGLPVPVQANAKVPCIDVSPWPVANFGALTLGAQGNLTIAVRNCGTETLTLTRVELVAGGVEAFLVNWAQASVEPATTAALQPSEATPLELAVGAKLVLPITYSPATLSPVDPDSGAPTPDVASLDIDSNAAPRQLKLQGVCVTATCPEAKISVDEGEEVIPQTVLHLRGDASIAQGGASISKFQWKVTKQPEGSKQTFVPGPSFPNPTFTANAAGVYEFCLEVFDSSDPPQKSCEPACVTVLVIPSEALHLELLWKTPEDEDETDKGQGVGADVDLHFAHPLAQGPDLDCDGAPDPWFSTQFDAFWFNPKPKWGSAGSEADDARLDLDDTDGAGPENVNLSEPQGNLDEVQQYHVGVHYWNDHGFGPSYATVRIYVLGNLVQEYTDIALKPLDMWYVGKLNWPNVNIGGGTEPVMQTCFQTGDQCKYAVDPTDPAAGQMWQPTGEVCIRRCYLSPLASSGGATCSP
jgi:hypothetical protein